MKMKTFAAVMLVAAAMTSAPHRASAQEFTALEGTWTGEFAPRSGEALAARITINPNGSYTWFLRGQRFTDGQLTRTAGTITYINQAGSRGTVVATPDALVWKNTFTGDNYTVTVRK